MGLEKFIRNFGSAIDGVEIESLTPDIDFQNDLKEWDSLAILTILAMIDSEYSVVLTAEDIKSCKSINELFIKVSSKSNIN